MKPRRRPRRLWLFFWGRRRRGFPGLLVAVLGASVLLGLTFARPGGEDLSHVVGLAFLAAIALLAISALALAAVAALRPRGRR